MRKLLENIFPVFFVIYPLLALLSANPNYVNFDDISRSLFFALAGMLLVWLVFRWMFKSWAKAGVIVSLLAVSFFSYGHIYIMATNQFGGGFSHLNLLIAYLLIVLILSGLVIFRIRERSQIPYILGVVGAVLVGMSAVQIGWYQYQVWQGELKARSTNPSEGLISGTTPDIYLIILDAHTRSDVLLRDYDVDNSEFISTLEESGFYVANCSQSNYPITDLALQSLFNMDYVHNFIEEGDVLPGLSTSIVKNALNQAGYTTIAFNNYFSSHYDLDEDVLLQRNASVTERVNLFTGLNEYESLVVETSAMRLLVDLQHLFGKFFGDVFSDEEKYYSHYLETLFILEELKNLPTQYEQKFVFAHFAIPHWPFVFSEEGTYEHIWGLPATEGYRKNVIFIDQQIPGVVEKIISQSETPPLIILMGDHGPTGDGVPIENRMSNLFAVYASEEIVDQLNASMTPVNTFRLILNQYFGTEYELLEDISYSIWNNETFDLEKVVPNKCDAE